MPVDDPDGRSVIAEARDRCRRLLDDLRRDAADLRRPSAPIVPDALAEGRVAYERAAAAAEALLRTLDEGAGGPRAGQHGSTDA